MGTVNRIHIEFSQSFWPTDAVWIGIDKGSDPSERGKFSYWLNMQPFTPKKLLPALVGVATAGYAEKIEDLTDQQVLADALFVLNKMFPNQVSQPKGFVVTRWRSDKFSGGSYTYAPAGSTDEDFDALGGHEQKLLFFAGEHTHRQYRGTVHGAFSSGLDSARSMIRALDSGTYSTFASPGFGFHFVLIFLSFILLLIIA